MSNDPYASRAGGGSPYSANNQLNDPYVQRDGYRNAGQVYRGSDPYGAKNSYGAKDPYASKDPYRVHDPYGLKDPYGEGVERVKPFMFWFWLKEQMQQLFNGDTMQHDMQKVYFTDKDFVRLRIAATMFGRAMAALVIVPTALAISFLLLLGANGAFKTIVLFTNFMAIAWVLYFPMHQVISSMGYAISSNTISYYNYMRKNFNSYQGMVVSAYAATILALAYFGYNPKPVIALAESMKFHLQGSEVRAALYLLAGVNGVYFFFYFVMMHLITKQAEAKRDENYKTNVVARMESPIERVQSKLDEF